MYPESVPPSQLGKPSVVQLRPAKQCDISPRGNLMSQPIRCSCCFEALITNLAGAKLLRIRVSRWARVIELKAELLLLHGFPIAAQRLILGTTVLADDELVSRYRGMESRGQDATLSLSLYLLPNDIILHIEELAKTRVDKVMEVFKKADSSVRECFEFVLCAVSRNGLVLEFASEDLQADCRIALAAVSQNGNSIRFVSEELRSDIAVVTAALTNDGKALKHLPEKLRQERRTVDLALGSDLMAIEFVDSSLWHKWRFRMFYYYLYHRSFAVANKSSIIATALFWLMFFIFTLIVGVLMATDACPDTLFALWCLSVFAFLFWGLMVPLVHVCCCIHSDVILLEHEGIIRDRVIGWAA